MMKRFDRNVTLVAVLMMIAVGCADSEKPRTAEVPERADALFDEALAKGLRADQYGMRSYVIAFLQAGLLALELHSWYGSAAVSQIAEAHRRIQAKKP